MLSEKIKELMNTDSEKPETISARVTALYKSADEQTKKTIDAVMVNLCGYSLGTLIVYESIEGCEHCNNNKARHKWSGFNLCDECYSIETNPEVSK